MRVKRSLDIDKHMATPVLDLVSWPKIELFVTMKVAACVMKGMNNAKVFDQQRL